MRMISCHNCSKIFQNYSKQKRSEGLSVGKKSGCRLVLGKIFVDRHSPISWRFRLYRLAEHVQLLINRALQERSFGECGLELIPTLMTQIPDAFHVAIAHHVRAIQPTACFYSHFRVVKGIITPHFCAFFS